MADSLKCPLCKSIASSILDGGYYQCHTCNGIFLNPELYISSDKEKEIYETHNNDVNDERYQEFVSPITNSILDEFSPHHKGLDFGAGTGPVISKVLQDLGYDVKQYDPYFYPDEDLLDSQYDYIACCEVIEHFHHPYFEFNRLKDILKPGGILYCMTHIYEDQIDFSSWYYRKDPTHVFIYRKQTLEWIKEKENFAQLIINNRLAKFKKGYG